MVREQAIVALSDYTGPDTSTTLLQIATHDAIVNNRVSAVRYLSHIGGKSSVAGLRQVFNGDVDLVVRLNAARELALYGDKSGTKLAHDSIESPNWAARYAAAGALGNLGDIKDVPMLEKVATNAKEDGGVRFAAFSSSQHLQLIQKSDSEQIETLKKSLGDDQPRVRRWAAFELATRKDRATREFLRAAAQNPGYPGRNEALSIIAVKGD